MTDVSKQPGESPAADGQMLRTLVQAGCDWLDQHHALVNQLNVFPVPDGDTGTNMLMTMRNALKEADAYSGNHAGQVAAKIAHGAMMGSRGNSGTILSQIWQGFAHALRDHETFNSELFAHALREASDTAYRGVIKPVEGTILTVAREAAEEAEAAYPEHRDLPDLMDRVLARAKDTLARTPEMLPILQKAGVVDSGGSGLVFILEGMARSLHGEAIETVTTAPAAVEDLAKALAPEDEMGYGYDVQFIITGRDLNVGVIRSAIDAMGWSTLVVGSDDAVKVHVHVHDPGIPLSYGISLGTLTDIVVENMQEQYKDYLRERTGSPAGILPAEHEHEPAPALELGEDDIGVVAVASGEGLARVFHQLGVTELIMGGQTNNPSTQEILDAIQRLPTKKVILLPNNKNIILAAEQAARLAVDRDVVIVPTRTMPQGISALLPYDPQGDLAETARAMEAAKDDVVTGEITTATRSVELHGVEVNQGQIIGLVDGVLAAAGDVLDQVLREVLVQMHAEDHELITLYYGNGVHRAEAEALVKALSDLYQSLEFEIVFGGQPHYHFILSAE